MMSEISGFAGKPSTTEELAAAKESSIRSLPGRFETGAATSGALGGIFLYHRPLDYYAKLPGKYESVTDAEVSRAAKEHLHPDQLVIVTAGDRSKIEPGLKDAQLGPIEVRDVSGDPVAEQK
jgi:zinc protease